MKFFVHDLSPVLFEWNVDFSGFSVQVTSAVLGAFLLLFALQWAFAKLLGKNFEPRRETLSHLLMGGIVVALLYVIAPEKIVLRYYGCLFALSVLCSWGLAKYLFVQRGYPLKDLDDFVWYTVVGGLLGLRLVHVLFYNPGYYFEDPVRILKVWEGGLASHGAMLGILIAVLLFAKKKDYSSYALFDVSVLAAAHGGVFVRLGNFMNSEIVGKPSDLPWAVVFMHYDYPQLLGNALALPENLLARHPSQIYEALFSLVIVAGLFFLHQRYRSRVKEGFLAFFYLAVYSLCRFLVEFVKESQTLENPLLTMGQYLSVPVFCGALWMLWRLR